MLTQQQSRSISSLKVIFCFLIILLHAHFQMPSPDTVSDGGGIVYNLQKFFREYLSTFVCGIAIPGFAVISGYLFFATENFLAAVYKRKIHSRLFTLLIPYIVWNLIVFAGDAILAFNGKNNLVSETEWNFLNVLNIFWSVKENGAGTCPYNGPLWYIRDLFILCLLSPVIYPFLKSRFVKYIFVVALFVALFVKIPYVYYHERIFTVYFCLGAFFAVNPIKFFSCNSFINKILLTGGGIANMLYLTNYFGFTGVNENLLDQIYVLCALAILPIIGVKYLQNEKIVAIAPSTFFIYCMHNSFLAMLAPLVRGQSSVVYLAYYLLIPVLDFATGYVLYLIVKKIDNPIMNLLLLGKRSVKK